MLSQSAKCIYCLKNSIGSREHIILSVLGGSRTSTDIVCAECNNKFSHAPLGIDNAVSRFFAPLCAQLWVFTDRGQPPSPVRDLLGSDGAYYDLCPGGIKVPSSQKYREEAPSDGQKRIALTLPTMARVHRRLPHLQRQHGEKLTSLTVRELFDPTHTLEISFKIVDTRFYRGLMKSLMNWLGVVSPSTARSPELDSARKYILHEHEDWLRLNVNYSVTWPGQIPFRVPVHALILDSRSQPGSLIGLVQMFGVLRFSTVLSSSYSGDAFSRALVIDPWARTASEISDIAPIDFPSDMTAQIMKDEAANMDMFDRCMKHLQSVCEFVATQTQVRYGIIRGIQQAKLDKGDDTSSAERVAELVAKQVAHRLVGLPLENELSIDSLEAEVEQESELQDLLIEWAKHEKWGDEIAQAQAARKAE